MCNNNKGKIWYYVREVDMSYTALYRKFRPKGFDEVKGQDSVVTVLKNFKLCV